MQLVLTKAYAPLGVVWCLAPCPPPQQRGRELRRRQSKGQRRRRRSSSSSSVRTYAKTVGLERASSNLDEEAALSAKHLASSAERTPAVLGALGDPTQRTLEQAPYPVGTPARDIDPVALVPSLGAPANDDNDAFAIDRGPADQRALFQSSKEHGATQLPPDPEWIDLDPSKLDWSDFGNVRWQIEAFLAFDAENGGFAAAQWPSLIGGAFPSLSGKMVGHQLMALVVVTFRKRCSDGERFQLLEYFAGVGRITRAAILRGLHCARFDKLYSDAHDCITPIGLRNWFDALMNTDPGAWAWLATECSPWVILCASLHKRTLENSYLGDIERAFVRRGNQLMTVSSLLFFVARLIDVNGVIEQPLNSKMGKAPPLKTVFDFCEVRRTTTVLQAFGAKTVKPLQLWHNHIAMSRLKRSKMSTVASETLCKVVGESGDRKRFSGRKHVLKASQQYTWQFACEIIRAVLSARLVR